LSGDSIFPLTDVHSAFADSVRDSIFPFTEAARLEPAAFSPAGGLFDQVGGIRDVLLDLSREQHAAGHGQLWLPPGKGRPARKLTPEQILWLLVIVRYLITAIAQHASSFVTAENPTFDLEKFVSQQVQAIFGGLGMYRAVLARRALQHPTSTRLPRSGPPPGVPRRGRGPRQRSRLAR
jgi:hypothetical protein